MKVFQDIIRFRKNFPIFIAVVIIALMAGFTAGCKDETILEDNNEHSSSGSLYSDEYSIGFTIQVDKNLTTRDDDFNAFHSNVETYDNSIDTQDKCRFFFFTEDGQFLFGAIDRTITSVQSGDYTHDAWYVRIPMTMIVDREGKEYPIEDLKTFLKKNKFKIAVLANWPNAGDKVNPGDYDDSEINSGNKNPSSTLKGNPQWGWDESVLNPDARNNGRVKNINDLHQIYEDSQYSLNETRIATYSFMMSYENGKYLSGEPTDWVQMRSIDEGWKADYDVNQTVPDFDTREKANAWIRANWSPDVELNNDKGIYRHYRHLWYLWNFDASYKYGSWLASNTNSTETEKKSKADELYGYNFGWGDDTPADLINPRGMEWYERNGESFYTTMRASYSNGSTLGNITVNSLSTDVEGKPFFRYNSITNGKAVMRRNMTDQTTRRVYDECYGIELPGRGTNRAFETTEGVICFQPRTTGTLRIKWSNPSATAEAKLYIQENGDKLKEYSIAAGNTSKIYDMGGTSNPSEVYCHLSFEGNSIPVYIFCSSGTATIHSIEYIRGKYLFETDRENVAPNSEQGIPMYGVQTFNPIGNWEYGTTYDLSPDTETASENHITLIRALAKIELYIPTRFSDKAPSHVYMRNLNRAARCEPMDVETPTNLLWDDLGGHQLDGSTYSCEFFSIRKYGAAYGSTKTNTEWLKWFYGSWDNTSWKVSGSMSSEMVWTKSSATGWPKRIEATPGEGLQTWNRVDDFPHLFNPYIDRSDFCEFLYAGIDDGGDNYKFVLYMPEKNIDDPSNVGEMTSIPRVPHIEFRYPEDASQYACSEFNLDDDDCYRVYFTNYGNEPLTPENMDISNVGKSRWSEYEKSRSVNDYHWPIMRNHIYQFYMGGSPEVPVLNVKVKDWGHEKVVVEW